MIQNSYEELVKDEGELRTRKEWDKDHNNKPKTIMYKDFHEENEEYA